RRFDIRRPGSRLRTEHIGDHFFSGKRCERQRTNEFLRRTGHDDLHANAAVLKEAHDFRRLISCYPTGHAQRNFHSRKAAATDSKIEPRPTELMPPPGSEIQPGVGGAETTPAFE